MVRAVVQREHSFSGASQCSRNFHAVLVQWSDEPGLTCYIMGESYDETVASTDVSSHHSQYKAWLPCLPDEQYNLTLVVQGNSSESYREIDSSLLLPLNSSFNFRRGLPLPALSRFLRSCSPGDDTCRGAITIHRMTPLGSVRCPKQPHAWGNRYPDGSESRYSIGGWKKVDPGLKLSQIYPHSMWLSHNLMQTAISHVYPNVYEASLPKGKGLAGTLAEVSSSFARPLFHRSHCFFIH